MSFSRPLKNYSVPIFGTIAGFGGNISRIKTETDSSGPDDVGQPTRDIIVPPGTAAGISGPSGQNTSGRIDADLIKVGRSCR